jgi:hypothetical protein
MRFHISAIVFVTFCALKGIECNSSPLKKISQILATTELLKCYSCEGACETPLTQYCEANNKCFSSSTKTESRTIETKGCIAANLSDTICKDNTDSCYTCDSDFCNADPQDTEVDTGVNKCYVCIDECKEPATKHHCEKLLTAIEGKVVKAACLNYQVTNGETVTLSKGCIPDDVVLRSTCTMANLVYPEVKCSMCAEDLCNTDDEYEDLFVDECYHCENDCEEPLAIQKCQDVLQEYTVGKCLAAKYSLDGQEHTVRTCVNVNEALQNSCDYINSLGGNCTICDTNLCIGVDSDVEENIVDECYFCEETCEEPIAIQQCKDVLGEDAKSKCLAMEYVENNQTVIVRKCVEVDDLLQDSCNNINQQGGNCTICDTNLCNGPEDTDDGDDGKGGSSLQAVYSIPSVSFLAILLVKYL